MNAGARLEQLHQAMGRIEDALCREQFDVMPAMLDAYDQGVREFCAMEGAGAVALGGRVQALYGRHQQVVELMRARQQQLLELMRAQRHSSRAVHAYAGAGAG